MNDMIGPGQGKPNATGARREDYYVESIRRSRLETVDPSLPFLSSDCAVDHHRGGGEPITALDQPGQPRLYCQIIDEQQRPLAVCRDLIKRGKPADEPG